MERAEISSVEPNNNNYKKHSREDQALMPMNGQVHLVGVKLQAIKIFLRENTELV